MTSSNRSLSDFLMEQDFVKLDEEARARKRQAQRQAIEERQKSEEEARIRAAQPKLTQKDVDQAEQRGLEKGLQMGKLEAKKTAHQEFQKHITELEGKLNGQEEIARKYIALMMESALGSTKIILEYILEDVSQRYPQEMLKKALERSLQRCEGDSELTIYIHPASQIYLADISKEFLKKKTYKVVEDSTLDLGACRIEWGASGVESSIEALHNDMQELLDGFRQGIHPEKVELPAIELPEEPEEADAETPAETSAENEPAEEITQEVQEPTETVEKETATEVAEEAPETTKTTEQT